MSEEKVLIVEDEVVVAMELRSRLTALGYEVVGSCDQGEQVADLVTRYEPDLILMDIKLAGRMDGIEAAQQIHSIRDVPVVFLTAHSDERTLQRAKLSDPYGYIVKPFSEAELRSTIEVSIHNHGRQERAMREALWFAKASSTFDGAVILCDENGTVKHMNALAQAITGLKSEEAIGRPVPHVLCLQDRQTGETINRLAVHEQDGLALSPFSVTLVAADRSEVPVRIMPVPITDSRQALSALLFLFREDPVQLPSGQDDFAHAANLILTAHLSQSDGEHLLAEHCYERALNLLEKALGPKDSRLGNILLDLAEVHKSLGKNLDARIVAARIEGLKSDDTGHLWEAHHGAVDGVNADYSGARGDYVNHRST